MSENPSLMQKATERLRKQLPENEGHKEEFATNPKRAWAREIGTVITNIYTNWELQFPVGASSEWEEFEKALFDKANEYGVDIREWRDKLAKIAESLGKKLREQN